MKTIISILYIYLVQTFIYRIFYNSKRVFPCFQLNDPQQQEQEQRQMSFFSEAMDNLFCLKSPNVIGVQLNFQTTLYQLANLDRYQWYSYSGSLTTPPYSESVTWIDRYNCC